VTPVTEIVVPGLDELDLTLTGMTCASCAARIEKKLNRLDGVQATVNFATEKASVTYDPQLVTAQRLVETVEAIGYGALPAGADVPATVDEPQDAATQDLRQRFVVAVVLGVPVLALSMIGALQFRNWQWIALALAAPVATWAAWPFHRAAWRNARHGAATMDTLVSVGVLAAFGASLGALLLTHAGDSGMQMVMTLAAGRGEQHHIYLEVASTTVALILGGRYFEARAKRRAGGALRALARLGAADAGVLDDAGHEQRRPAEQLRVGDRFVVRPGEKIATDGVVESGGSSVDAALVTGESVPVEVGPGSTVIGATINVDGSLVVRATRVGADTAVAHIARLVEQAQSGKAPVQRLADQVAAVFVPIVMALAAATLGFWAARTGSIVEAITPAVAVLIIACPCALGLATPTALLVGTGRGAEGGILISGPEVLEATRRVDVVVLDKTGTLTTGQMEVVEVVALASDDPLALAAAVEAASEHPIAAAIGRAAAARGLEVPPASGFRAERGVGATAVVIPVTAGAGLARSGGDRNGGRTIHVGRTGPVAPDRVAELEAGGATVVVVSELVDGEPRPLGLIALADTLRPTSAVAVRRLDALGIDALLVTGDNRSAAVAAARAVGIADDDVRAGVLPNEKVDVVRRLQAAGKVVAMVGDGVNDAAALAQADLGIAMAGGTDVAIEASDITLVRPDLDAAVDAIRLSRRTLAVIKGNLFWAFAYNVAAIPLAMAWLLSPLVAGAAMAFSSVFVVTNSLRLRRFRFTP
jgi:P-type Cu+ transporter